MANSRANDLYCEGVFFLSCYFKDPVKADNKSEQNQSNLIWDLRSQAVKHVAVNLNIFIWFVACYNETITR